MGAHVTVADIIAPASVATKEKASLFILLDGAGGALTNYTVLLIDPDGQAINITANFAAISAASAFATMFMAPYVFMKPGHYCAVMQESSGGDIWTASIIVSEWPNRIDIPVSQLEKQRADIQRIYGRVS